MVVMASYRFVGEIPCAVRFNTGIAVLFEYEGEDGQYYVTARKPDERGSEITLIQASTLPSLHKLKIEGFELQDGGAADMVMRRLLRTGAVDYAQDAQTEDGPSRLILSNESAAELRGA